MPLLFFWGEGCSYCEAEREFIEELKAENPGLEVLSYEVWHNEENAEALRLVLEAFDVKTAGVPVTVFGNRMWVGFSNGKAQEIRKAVAEAGHGVDAGRARDFSMSLPFIGKLDTEGLPLLALAVIIGGLDSFNPCAFFVLLFLLSLLIHARSRARMLLIGGTFVLFSGIMYFLFMAAWLNVFMLAGRIGVITSLAGVVALLVAAINIKDFFLFKRGVSLSITEGAMSRLLRRMRGLLKSPSAGSMALGAVVLAVAANTYELLCTAGFPMVFTRLLTLHELGTARYYMYLAVYNCVYVVPLAVIVLIFSITLGGAKLSEWQGRKLKLVSGIMMLLLGGALVLDPLLLNNALISIGLLAAALSSSFIVITISKRLLPGIKDW